MSIKDSLHSSLQQLPAICAVLLKFRCALSFTLSDLSAYYKRNLLSPESALLSAIWLQASDDSDFPFLNPNQKEKLELFVNRSANCGYRDSSSHARISKNSMGKFYRQYFPEGIQKLSEDDI